MKVKAGDPIACPDGTWCVWGEGLPLLWGSSQQTVLSEVSLALGSHTQAVESMAMGARRWDALATQAPSAHRMLSKRLKLSGDTSCSAPPTSAALIAAPTPVAPILTERQREQRARKAVEVKPRREIIAAPPVPPKPAPAPQPRATPKVKTPAPSEPAPRAPHPRKVATDEEIIAAYGEHTTARAVAKELHAHQRRVLAVLRAAGKLRPLGKRSAGANPGGKPTALDAATIETLVARWLRGEATGRELAAEYGVSRGTVSAYIARTGVKARKFKLDEEAISWIVARYAQGEPVKSLAEAYGCSPSTIYTHLLTARWNGSLGQCNKREDV